MKTKAQLVEEKWNAIEIASQTIGEARNDLFDKVALALARIEGQMQFLNGENSDNEPFLEGHAQAVGLSVEQDVKNARKALDEIFADLTEGRDALL